MHGRAQFLWRKKYAFPHAGRNSCEIALSVIAVAKRKSVTGRDQPGRIFHPQNGEHDDGALDGRNDTAYEEYATIVVVATTCSSNGVGVFQGLCCTSQ